ncbi:hypothetical protein LguiA_012205 [Lonicera macranthoides]
MAFSSTAKGNSSMEVDIRFMLKQCECGALVNVKITKLNKNNNCGRIYYSCKRQRCRTFLGWCKIDSFGQTTNIISTLEECNTLRNLVVGEVNTKWEMVLWRILIIISFFLSIFCTIKAMI